jgi:DNA-binding NarL/FixJ family response regulator
MEKISLLIAEDHNLVREGLVNILKENDWIDIIFEAETGEELVNGYFANKPDIVLTDIKMPSIDGLTAAEKILKKDADAKILFLSMFSSKQYAYEVNQLGGKGLLPKNINKEELSLALKTVVEGGKYFSGFSEEDLIKLEGVSNSDQNGIDITIKRKLSKRELEILNLIAEGCSSDEIAEKLFIARRTVDSHRRSIMDKLNIDSAPKLIKVAVENRDIEKDE